MKKQLLAASVAASIGVLGSGIASAMEFSVYGSIRAGIYQKDTDDAATLARNAKQANGMDSPDLIEFGEDASFDEDGLGDRGANKAGGDAWETGVNNFGSRIGIKGSEDLGNGTSAGFVFERGTDDATELGRRHENVWLQGGWGKLTLGQTGNVYRNAANWDQSTWLGGQARGGDGGARVNSITYDSNLGGPFSFSLQAVASDSSSAVAADSADFSATGSSGGGDTYTITGTLDEIKDEDGIDAFAASASLAISDFATVNIGYRTDNVEASINTDGDLVRGYDLAVISANGVAGALHWYVNYEQGDDNSDFSFEDNSDGLADCDTGDSGDNCRIARAFVRNYVSEVYATEQDREVFAVYLAYALGERDTIWLEYEDLSRDGADANLGGLDLDSILLGYSHSFGPHTTFVAEYVQVDNESDFSADVNQFWAGLKVEWNTGVSPPVAPGIFAKTAPAGRPSAIGRALPRRPSWNYATNA